ncbi:MAG: tRNA (N(6)-L-threonylcarbamoyladenosine(37)-C(2))-methylthiotransferase MtaB [Alphaproteobacteria bacterium]|nr:tRNA (N(6)-L-threonylcarbamoyladenosine(37)-C(2))-methylthiotransferase MtaB [Alphaproteobacteria bacterium]
MSGIDVLTFGCRLNAYESEVMRGLAGAAGLEDAVIVNTCAVTAEAERQARQAIRRARRERPGAHIVVTGCAAQIDPARYAAMPEVDQVIGNAEKLTVEGFVPAEARVRVNDIQSVRETAHHLIESFDGKARAVVQVQQGCDHRCTFCVIPLGRGRSRSVPVGVVARQTQALVDAGYPEIVLSGVDITSYGADLPGKPSLGQMVRRVLAQVPELMRLRLSSLDPVEIDEDLWRLIAEEPRLMPHLHLSLQAGDDLVLKRMKRRHGRGDALAVARRARQLRPEIAFGADLIAGFPTETEAMFENTLALVEEADLAYLHVFPYSERPGTPAARMPSVPKPVRKMRAQRLRDAGTQALHRHLDRQIGRTARAVVETETFARAEDFSPIVILGGTPGAVLSLHLAARSGDQLVGRPIS